MRRPPDQATPEKQRRLTRKPFPLGIPPTDGVGNYRYGINRKRELRQRGGV